MRSGLKSTAVRESKNLPIVYLMQDISQTPRFSSQNSAKKSMEEGNANYLNNFDEDDEIFQQSYNMPSELSDHNPKIDEFS